MTSRREVLTACALGAFAAALPAFAQQPAKVWRLGFLSLRPRPASVDADMVFGGLFARLRELGYIEGKNLIVEWRLTDGTLESSKALVSELVNLKVDAILSAGGNMSVRAAKLATNSVPIIVGVSSDAVANGLIKSLAKPEANVTGISLEAADVQPKVIEILQSFFPRLSRIAVLANPNEFVPGTTSSIVLDSIRAITGKLGIKVIELPARTAAEIEQILSRIKPGEAQALIVINNPLYNSQRARIAALALKAKLPSASTTRDFVDAGGLASYGPSIRDAYTLSATYVDRIFKGAKPGELPMQQPSRFYLQINRKTAKALGITIPRELLLRADEVIE